MYRIVERIFSVSIEKLFFLGARDSTSLLISSVMDKVKASVDVIPPESALWTSETFSAKVAGAFADIASRAALMRELKSMTKSPACRSVRTPSL